MACPRLPDFTLMSAMNVAVTATSSAMIELSRDSRACSIDSEMVSLMSVTPPILACSINRQERTAATGVAAVHRKKLHAAHANPAARTAKHEFRAAAVDAALERVVFLRALDRDRHVGLHAAAARF